MKTILRMAAAIFAVALAFTLTACGNAAADHAKASIKASILKDAKDSKDTFKLNDKQAGCFADSVVDKIGLKQLKTYKMVDDKNNAVDNALDDAKLSKADATTLVNSMFDCTDGGKIIIEAITSELNSSLTGVPAATATCIKSKLTESVVRETMIAGFSGGDSTQAMQTAAMSCISSSK